MKTQYILSFCALLLMTACHNEQPAAGANTFKVKAVEVTPKDTPVTFQHVGQTKSSRQVEIRARVDGFLDKVAYTEGSLVKESQVLFELDRKPFEANLQQARGELALQQARLANAVANLRRIKPLSEKDAVSKKDLDDAVSAEQGARASVLAAQGVVRQAELNLSYATIASPLTGLASKTAKQEGSYVPMGQESLLTYVAQLDPIWVQFTISENQIFEQRNDVATGNLILPPKDEYEVEIVFADGSVHPFKGKINFSEPNIDPESGTRLFRAELPNSDGLIRPGQFVRVNLHGAIRPHAIVIPQQAVIQGAKGHFVWVINKENKAEVRLVEVGPLHGDGWFIEKGLNPLDKVITEGVMMLSEQALVTQVE